MNSTEAGRPEMSRLNLVVVLNDIQHEVACQLPDAKGLPVTSGDTRR